MDEILPLEVVHMRMDSASLLAQPNDAHQNNLPVFCATCYLFPTLNSLETLSTAYP